MRVSGISIQIQHLLLFNQFLLLLIRLFLSIQIQHLLLFNRKISYVNHRRSSIQIQHLLLFNRYLALCLSCFISFKYNTCYCSTNKGTAVMGKYHLFKYNTCYCSTGKKIFYRIQRLIQIQHLLLFNHTALNFLFFPCLFKYNTCYCST